MKFGVGSHVQLETPEEDRRTHKPKCFEYYHKDEDNDPHTLNNKLKILSNFSITIFFLQSHRCLEAGKTYNFTFAQLLGHISFKALLYNRKLHYQRVIIYVCQLPVGYFQLLDINSLREPPCPQAKLFAYVKSFLWDQWVYILNLVALYQTV